jgi:hypothetical protein
MNLLRPYILASVVFLAIGIAAQVNKPIATAERYGKAERISAVGPGKFKIIFTQISGSPKFLKVTDGTHTLELPTGQRLEIIVVPCADFEVYESNPFGLSRVKVSEIRVSEWRECYPELPTGK